MSALTCPNGHGDQTPEGGQFCPQCGAGLIAAPAAKHQMQKGRYVEAGVVMGFVGLGSYYVLTDWLSHPLSFSLALFIAFGILAWAAYWEKHRSPALVALGALALASTGVFFITRSTGFSMPWSIGLALLLVGLVNRLIMFIQQR
jgi:drug/metabolite transporter (DMT)-like permease